MQRKNHLILAHHYWKTHLKKDDNVIDATAGNGHDTLVLANLVNNGKIFVFDIQKQAIENTKKKLSSHLSSEQYNKIFFYQCSHEHFSSLPNIPIHLIVYNLGYLPGGDKSITTLTSITLKSIQHALILLAKRGAISIICYPGHEEGKQEEKALLSFLHTLPSNKWAICYHQWINKKEAPSFLWIEKIQ